MQNIQPGPAMELTQSFRLNGNNDIAEISCVQVDGQSVVIWEDIERGFPGVQLVKNGNLIVSLMKYPNQECIWPHRIKHHPDVVLNVILASVVNHVHGNASMATSRQTPTDGRAQTPTHALIDHYRPGAIMNELNVNPRASSAATLAESVSGLAIASEPFTGLSSAEPLQATVTRASTAQIESQFNSVAAVIEQARRSARPLTAEELTLLIASKLTPVSLVKSGFERTVMHKLDGLHDQGAMTQQIALK
ncbi:hypothetical protein BGZ96_007097, partial [Linnemannia gamsii]